VVNLVTALNHTATLAAVTAERELLHTLDSGCQFPVGGHATIVNSTLNLVGFVGREDGSRVLIEKLETGINRAEDAGKKVAEKLIERGALQILNT
jgi:hydroxymethylbilane synthase